MLYFLLSALCRLLLQHSIPVYHAESILYSLACCSSLGKSSSVEYQSVTLMGTTCYTCSDDPAGGVAAPSVDWLSPSIQQLLLCNGAGDETLFAASHHISNILDQFNQQNLALALWSFAKLGWRPDTALLADACQHALLTVQSINPQNLANILWALATLEFVPPPALLEVGSPPCQCIIRLSNCCHLTASGFCSLARADVILQRKCILAVSEDV